MSLPIAGAILILQVCILVSEMIRFIDKNEKDEEDE